MFASWAVHRPSELISRLFIGPEIYRRFDRVDRQTSRLGNESDDHGSAATRLADWSAVLAEHTPRSAYSLFEAGNSFSRGWGENLVMRRSEWWKEPGTRSVIYLIDTGRYCELLRDGLADGRNVGSLPPDADPQEWIGFAIFSETGEIVPLKLEILRFLSLGTIARPLAYGGDLGLVHSELRQKLFEMAPFMFFWDENRKHDVSQRDQNMQLLHERGENLGFYHTIKESRRKRWHDPIPVFEPL